MARRSARKTSRGARSAPPVPPAQAPRATWRTIDPDIRAAGLSGLLAGIIIVGLFYFPLKVDPIESLALCIAMIVFGVVLCGSAFRSGEARFMRAAGSPASLAVLLLAAWAVVRWRMIRFPLPDSAAEFASITSAGRDGVIALQLFAFGFIFGLGLGTLRSDRAATAWRTFRLILIGSTVIFSMVGLYQYFIGYPAQFARLNASATVPGGMDPLMLQSLKFALNERRVGGTLGNGNIYAALLSVLAGLSLSLLKRDNAPFARAAGMAVYLLAVAALLLTGSRGGVLTLVFATTGASVLLWRGRSAAPENRINSPARPTSIPGLRVLWPAGALLLATRGAWAIDIGYRLTRITTIRERLNYWAVALHVWATHILIGGGPGSFEILYPRFKAATSRESRYAHSWFFQTGAELGIIGLLLSLLFWAAVAYAAWRVWSRLRKKDSPAAFPAAREASWLALSALILGFNGLFEYSLQTAEFLALLGLVSGGLVGLADSIEQAENTEASVPSSRIRAGQCVAALAMFSVAASIWLIPRAQFAANWEWKARGAAMAADPGTAAISYARAARWLPDEEGYLMGWSAALLQLPGRENEAGALVEQAEKLNPLSARVRAGHAQFMERMGDRDAALQRMSEAVERYPTDAGYRLQRAQMLHRLGRDVEARSDLAYVENEGIPIWAYQRPAFDELREALGLDPTLETVKERRRAVEQNSKASASERMPEGIR